MSIQLNGINCFYGAHQALFDITLDCPQGETLVLLGPSGAGKSLPLLVYSICLRCRAPVRSTLQATISISPKHPLTKRFAICVVTLASCFSNTTCGRI